MLMTLMLETQLRSHPDKVIPVGFLSRLRSRLRRFYAANRAAHWQTVPLKVASEYSAEFLMLTTSMLEMQLRSHVVACLPHPEKVIPVGFLSRPRPFHAANPAAR